MLTFGPKVPETDFDVNIFQGYDPICAIRCQEMIMRDFGIQIPKDELVEYATAHGWYHGTGTKVCDIGNLLETCNIGTHSQHCDSVYDLINELKDGHRVIVGVDSHELWAEPGSLEYKFYRHLTNADHALLVTSVNVDPDNPENSTVVLTDPGNGSILTYDFERFAHAWKDSNCFMMATDEPAPYQYNSETGCMEVSNFASDYTISEFPFHNEFTDIWQVDNLGYVPYYGNGHLDLITDEISYDDFVIAYNGEASNSILDESFGMNEIPESMVQVDLSDIEVEPEVIQMENLFNYADITDCEV